MQWTGMNFASSAGAAEGRTRWKGIVVRLSVVPKLRIARLLWDRLGKSDISEDITDSTISAVLLAKRINHHTN